MFQFVENALYWIKGDIFVYLITTTSDQS